MSSFFFLIWNYFNFNFQEFFIWNSLQKNCFCNNFWSIYFDLHFSSEIEVHEQRYYFKKIFKFCECFLNLFCKCEEFNFFTHFAFLEQVDKQFNHMRIIVNKSSIKIHEIEKYLYLSKYFKFWLIYNNVDSVKIY